MLFTRFSLISQSELCGFSELVRGVLPCALPKSARSGLWQKQKSRCQVFIRHNRPKRKYYLTVPQRFRFCKTAAKFKHIRSLNDPLFCWLKTAAVMSNNTAWYNALQSSGWFSITRCCRPDPQFLDGLSAVWLFFARVDLFWFMSV